MRNVRTPASLKWLIRKSARIMGEIMEIEKRLPQALKASKDACDSAEKKLKFRKVLYTNLRMHSEKVLPELKLQLEAIDVALGIHEIQFDKRLISPVKPQTALRQLQFGAITRRTFEYLRICGRPATTKEIALYISSKHTIDESALSFVELTSKVSDRLKALACQGKLKRLHNIELGSNQEGIWTLPS
jgi:hypothetical protein